jgi:hypothetical protein
MQALIDTLAFTASAVFEDIDPSIFQPPQVRAACRICALF